MGKIGAFERSGGEQRFEEQTVATRRGAELDDKRAADNQDKAAFDARRPPALDLCQVACTNLIAPDLQYTGFFFLFCCKYEEGEKPRLLLSKGYILTSFSS